jgi:oligoendopeptidase F
MTATPARTTRDFVPAALDATKWDLIRPLLESLRDREVNSAAELEAWLLDRSELEAAISESEAVLYINMTCDTGDAAAAQAYREHIETIPPKVKPIAFELDKKQVALFARFGVTLGPAGRYTVLERDTRAAVELFRDENVPIETELAKLGQRFEELSGAMSVQFEGREQTMPQMGKYQEMTDRAIRESAWRAVADRRLKYAEALDSIYDEMVTLRHRVAKNAGFDSYVGFAFKSKLRFDYTPRHCRDFHEACRRHIVPLVADWDRRRASLLKIPFDQLRPWDLSVDPLGRGPLRPFEGGRELVSKSVAVFQSLDPRLAKMLSSMGDGSNTQGARTGACLDLDSRKGKAPGGYQYNRDRSRKPFIFMNAAGRSSDVTTMLHEAGHAFHSMLADQEPLLAYRHSPIEFAEVASMSMELLTIPHMRAFYPSDEEFARATRLQLERSVGILPWIATIDAFQHWIYEHPDAATSARRAERTGAWLELEECFGHPVNWQGLHAYRATMWHRQLHLFTHPFYYIEYGIAQLGALQLWLMSLERGPTEAVSHYLKALSLGGSKPLPELFAAAGLTFDFGPDTVARLTDRVRKEMDKLPE